MNRHAYLILAHNNPSQLHKLLELLDDGRNDIFVHIDAKARFSASSFAGCCSRSRLVFISPRIKVHWGGVSIMRAELALLKAAIGGHYAYYHLLSGQDLPIKSQDRIHDFFDAHQGKEFLLMWKMKDSTHTRFNYYTLFPEGSGLFWKNILNNLFKGLLMALGMEINKGIEFRYAAQWFSITDDFAHYVVSNEAWLEDVFKRTGTCDEVFMPTLLHRSHFEPNLFDKEEHDTNVDIYAEGNMRFIDWSRGESIRHPWVFREDDWILLKGVPHLWARKFDEKVDPAIIDRIYSDLMMKS